MDPERHPVRLIHVPACPRCGYDQSGATATWVESCPLSGVCSECGYQFEWSDVMHPERRRLRGFFEHECGLVRSWISAMRTLWWALPPWVFWSKVKLHHEVRPRRVLSWLCVAFGSMWLLIAGIRWAAYLAVPWTPGGSWTFREECILASNAVLYPFATVGLARTNPGPNSPWRVYFEWMLPEWSPIFLGLLGLGVTPPLVLLMLPNTRQRTGVCALHVLRAAVYGQSWLALHLVLLLAMAMHGVAVGDFKTALGGTGWLSDTWQSNFVVYVLGLVVWISVWWWFALARGFQIGRPTLHWAALMVPALLVFASFVAILDPEMIL